MSRPFQEIDVRALNRLFRLSPLLLASSLVAGCTDDADGQIVVGWSLQLGDQELSCEDAEVANVRIDAIDFVDGAVTPGGTHPCSSGGLVFNVAGGSYLLTIDTLDAQGVVVDHEQLLTVVAAGGVTTAHLAVPITPRAGYLHATWSAGCAAGDVMRLEVLSEDETREYTRSVSCTANELTSQPIPIGAYYARMVWATSGGADRLRSYWKPFTVETRGQLIELGMYDF